ncbi:paraquat-inducible protein A [Escherichia coli]
MERRLIVAAVIFLASIMVPTLKMIAIAWLCWDAKGHGKRDSERMHLIYEVVEFVGRWSMIDVFVIAVLSALVRMGGLMSIYPGNGCINVCFSRHNDNVFCYDV